MENNEDNRQMTPIQEAIYNIDTQISVLQEALKLKYGTFFENIPYKIRCEIRDLENIKGMLESLLPKEEQQLISLKAESFKLFDPMLRSDQCEKRAKHWFNENYTQDYKTKY